MNKKILGSGEPGKEFTIAAKRIGQTVIAVDSYERIFVFLGNQHQGHTAEWAWHWQTARWKRQSPLLSKKQKAQRSW
jgi:hypothetical protein